MPITTASAWSDKDMVLNDYASRTWNGLTGTLYKVRWEKFFQAVKVALQQDGSFGDDDYKVFSDDVTTFEKQWWDERLHTFPSAPVGNAKEVAAELYAKYKDEIL